MTFYLLQLQLSDRGIICETEDGSCDKARLECIFGSLSGAFIYNSLMLPSCFSLCLHSFGMPIVGQQI